jgi:hypothetical protein
VLLTPPILSSPPTTLAKTNFLKWSTAQEFNTDKFEIHTYNNRDFVSIGTVETLIMARPKMIMVFNRRTTIKELIIRLKLLDKDGKFTYSAIIM